MSGITLKTNEEWKEMVKEYKELDTADSFAEIFYALKPMSDKIATKWHYAYENNGVPKDDYIAVADFSIYKTLQSYDMEKGGSLTAMVKQGIEWAIQDGIIRPSRTYNNTINDHAVYLDTPISEGESLLDVIEHEFAISEEDIYGDVLESDTENLVSAALRLIREFTEEATEHEGLIVKTVFETILNIDDVSSKKVNADLAIVFPDVKAPTLRKRKQRALTHFTEFAKSNGFNQIDVSQF